MSEWMSERTNGRTNERTCGFQWNRIGGEGYACIAGWLAGWLVGLGNSTFCKIIMILPWLGVDTVDSVSKGVVAKIKGAFIEGNWMAFGHWRGRVIMSW